MSQANEAEETSKTTQRAPLPSGNTPVALLDRSSFPDKPKSTNKAIPATLENFCHIIDASNIRIRFNVIKKRADVEVPGLTVGRQNRDAVILSHIESLLIRNDMSPAQARSYILVLADAAPFDPFADWVTSRPWDGQSRLPAICDTIAPAEGYPLAFRDTLIRKWLLSIVAATFVKPSFRVRGVLTLQGAQGIGKTSWIANLVTPPGLREEIVKLGHSWDGGEQGRSPCCLAASDRRTWRTRSVVQAGDGRTESVPHRNR